MLSTHIRWIKQQIKKAEKDLEEAERRLKTWTEALRLATPDQEETEEGPTPAPPRGTSRVPILAVAEEALKQFKFLSSNDLQRYFAEKGLKTSANSINTSLNRFKSKRFDRTKGGKWYLIPKKEDDLSQEDDVPF